MSSGDKNTRTDAVAANGDGPTRSPRRPGQTLPCGWRVADPAAGAGSDPEVVLVLMSPPSLGADPRGLVGSRRRPGRRPGR